MSIRAKFRPWSRTEMVGYAHSVRYRFEAVYDDGIPENARFAKATPSGFMEMQVDNPAAIEQLDAIFKAGKSVYLDMTPAD